MIGAAGLAAILSVGVVQNVGAPCCDPEKPLKVDTLSELEAARRLAFLMTKAAGNAA